MRILTVVNSLAVGGAERHTVGLAAGLRSAGDDVHLVCLADRLDLREQLPAGVQAQTTVIRRGGPVDLQAIRALAALRRRIAPDLVVTVNQYPQVFHGWSAHGAQRLPPVVNIQHSMAYPGDNWLKLAVARRFQNAAQAVVYLSTVQRDFWRDRGVRPVREEIIPSGIDLDRFRPASPALRARLRVRARVGEGELLLGVCAGLRDEKRHDVVLAAAAQLRLRGVDLRLLFIGDVPRRAALEGLAAQFGLRDRLQITGYVHDVEDWLRACDIVCLSSSHEVLPLSLMEAQAAGVPVIASAVGATEDLIERGVTGLLFSAGDTTRLADAVQHLSSPARRQAIGLHAQRHAQAHYGHAAMLSRYRALFEELVGRDERRLSA